MSKKPVEDYTIKPENKEAKIDTSDWPLLLKNFDKLLVRSYKYTPINAGSSPTQRPLEEHLKYGVINLGILVTGSSGKISLVFIKLQEAIFVLSLIAASKRHSK